MFQRRVVGLVLSISAVVLVVAAIASHQWWTGEQDEGSVHVGLWDAEVCARGEHGETVTCREGSLARLLRGELDHAPRGVWDEMPSDDRFSVLTRPRASTTFVALGAFTLLAGIGTAIALIVACATSHRGGSRNAAVIALVGCCATAVFALGFVLTAPERLSELRAGAGFLLALAGAAAGGLGSVAFLRIDPATEPSDERIVEAHRFSLFRAPALAAGALGAALILGSVFTDTWFRGREEGVTLRVGLQDVEICRHAQCWNQTIPARVDGARHPTRMKIFVAVGTLTMWAGLAAALTYAMVAMLALLRQASRRLPLAMHAASGSYALLSIAYAFSWPKEIEDVHIWLGPFLAVGGSLAFLACGVMLSKWLASVPVLDPIPAPVPVTVPVPDSVSVPEPVIPACPVCHTPLLWVTAKQSWLCTICPRNPSRELDA
jgi:hypothetical protein